MAVAPGASDTGSPSRLRRVHQHPEQQTEAGHQGRPPRSNQYLGRTHFAAGHIGAAVESFTRALDLRVEQSADAALIHSSTVALQRARDVLELAS